MSATTHRRRTAARTTSRKLVVSLGVVGAAAAVAGMGTFGTFTSTTSASERVDSGTVSIAVGAAGSATNRLSVTAANIVPGDTVSRAVTLTNGSTVDALGSVVLNTSATVSSILDTGANGLTMTVQSCPTAWGETAAGTGYTYSCSVAPTTVVASRAVIGSALPITTPALLAPGGAANLVVTLTLPTAADNAYQTKTSTIAFDFVGTQRNGTAR